MNQYQTIVEEVRKIAREHLSFSSVKEKGGAENAVTDSDVLIQRDLMKKLSEIIPGSMFYCEEEGYNSLPKAEYVFIIDPIDGTMNYTRRIPECAISVGLLHNNELVFSCVYNLFKDEMFYAVKGKGAYFQGKKIHVSDRDFKHSIFYTGFSLYEKKYADPCIEMTKEVFHQVNDIFATRWYLFCLLWRLWILSVCFFHSYLPLTVESLSEVCYLNVTTATVKNCKKNQYVQENVCTICTLCTLF